LRSFVRAFNRTTSAERPRFLSQSAFAFLCFQPHNWESCLQTHYLEGLAPTYLELEVLSTAHEQAIRPQDVAPSASTFSCFQPHVQSDF
jgi:hypothetical protein